MTSLVLWLQENAADFLRRSITQKEDSSIDVTESLKMSRLWIYSHHIYRKELLKKIPASAQELQLTGFVLPGKPGIICVEGEKENCDEFWQKLKYPNWKHISCKHREDDFVFGQEEAAAFRLFDKFEELTFEAHGDYGLRNDYHMDLGQFRCYLQKYNRQNLFQIFFGLEGKK